MSAETETGAEGEAASVVVSESGGSSTAVRRTRIGAVVASLTRTELLRLAKNPFIWGAAAVAFALPVLLSVRQPMVANLEYEVQLAGTGALLIAVTVMVTANLGAVRDQRRGMPQTLAALPAGAMVRTLAVAIACGLAGALLTAVTVGAHVLFRLGSGPVAGGMSVWEIPAVVEGSVVLTVLGVTLGRWMPTLIAVPVVLVVFLALTVDQGTTVWPLPITSLLAGDVLQWPAGSRSVYLAALVVLLAAVALLRHGMHAYRALAGALALALAAPLLLSGNAAAHEGDAAELSCTDRTEVRYCHLPGFDAWVPLWAEAAEPVVAAVPAAERDAVPVVKQYRTTMSGAQQGGGLVGTEWGRDEVEKDYQRMLAGELAARITGLDDGSDTSSDPTTCAGDGQARTVVALWLAGQTVTPEPESTVDEMGLTALGHVGYSAEDGRVARTLLRREDAGERIGAHWKTLVRPETDLQQARSLLGLADTSGSHPQADAGAESDGVPQAKSEGPPCR
ncbi:hypothetical protein [Streptomyces sulphureus]|uniref:hypothetical protein n=1 Tax=Streptomyces sulphureus TaxID=47758 RepID=UPI00039AA5C2|nr:hypothetical protein [Streptomyces sulphureus]